MEPDANLRGQVVYEYVCDLCKEKNLTDQITLVTCVGCDRIYCVHFASTVDPQYCSACNHDVNMTEETIVKTQEHYNEETDTVYKKTSKARQIKFTGLDFLFYSKKISQVTDIELGLMIEYHRSILAQMLYERDERRIQYAHRNAGKQYTISNLPSSSDTNTNTTTTVKKTKTVSVKKIEKTDANVRAMLELLLKQGMKPQDIAAMLGGKK